MYKKLSIAKTKCFLLILHIEIMFKDSMIEAKMRKSYPQSIKRNIKKIQKYAIISVSYNYRYRDHKIVTKRIE